VDGVFDNSSLLFHEISLQDVDMTLLVKQITDMFSHQTSNLDIKCSPLFTLRTDAFLMEHIFSNLIDNAIKYLCSQRPGVVTIGGKLEGGEAHFYVRDNGIGVSDSAVNIFELFRQANTKSTGNGIGLALVETMVAKLRGKIWYETNKDFGTTFSFCVPL
jgi:signal transduction histidine kinase